jgi:2-polyprenyl-3-methyl-5-hydroxy-6-metoxy-1,4-benzoquinol methylase
MNGKGVNCRVCNGALYAEDLISLSNMPATAQNFPDSSGLSSDKGADLGVAQCSACGLVQLRNTPVAYYKDVIRASAYSDEMRTFRLTQFDQFIVDHKLHNKQVIEIGCGRGEYLTLMQEAGMTAFGLEHLESSVEYCRNTGLSVTQGYPDDADMTFDNAPYDAFLILNFFEHLPDPVTTLKAVSKNLSDDAIGLIEVPNFDAIMDKKLFSEFINDHLFYFTRETLESTLRNNGFDILDSRSIWHDYILSITVRKKQPTNLSALTGYQQKIADELNTYLDRHRDKKCAVWGAGHQALAVLSLADLGSKIELVLDSAPFKQNKYTPATHIPIKDPSSISDEKIELVIIMAAAYTNEIVRIINERFPQNSGHLTQVAALRDYGLEIIRE